MSGLVDFLLARIAEDADAATEAARYGAESWGEEAHCWDWDMGGPVGSHVPMTPDERQHIARHDPARVLADCTARRQIIDAYVDERDRRDIYQSVAGRAAEVDETVDPLIRERQIDARRSAAARCRGLEIAVELLARVYAGHPDFDASWTVGGGLGG